MKGTFFAVVCLLGLYFWIQSVAGAHLDPGLPGGRCRCRKVTMKPVAKHVIKLIEVIPSRVYCPMIEIIIRTKNNQAVCIDPEAEWFKNMFPRLILKKKP